MKKDISGKLIYGAKWAIVLGLLVLSFYYLDLEEIRGGIGKVSLLTFFLFFLGNGLFRLLYVVRWSMIGRLFLLPPEAYGIGFLYRVYMLGEFVAIALPTNLGTEGVRVYKVHEKAGDFFRVTAFVVLDRLMGVMAIMFIAAFFLPYYGFRLREMLGIHPAWLLAAGPPVLIALWIVWRYVRRSGRFRRVAEELSALRDNYLKLIGIFAFSVLCHLIFAMVFYGLILTFASINLVESVGLVIVSHALNVVPVSVAGMGPGDGSFITLGALHGLSHEHGVIVVALWLLNRWIYSILGVLAELYRDGRDFFKFARGPVKES